MITTICITATWLALNIALAVGATIKPLPPHRMPGTDLPAHGWKDSRVRWQ